MFPAVLVSVSILAKINGDGSESNPYFTIQHAISQSANGDIITINDGTYSGNGNVELDLEGKQIVVQTKNGPSSTIIDCGGTSRAFFINQGESNSTKIRGFGFINGSYDDVIFVEDNSGIEISHCIFENNQNCIRFGDNEQSGPQSIVKNCVFDSNSGSCIVSSKKAYSVDNCILQNNTRSSSLCSNGHASNPNLHYTNCIFRNNPSGGIIALGHDKW